MKSIKQYFDIKRNYIYELDADDLNKALVTAISDTKNYIYKRIVDDGKNMVTLYKSKDEGDFLLVVSTEGNGDDLNNISVNYYFIETKEDIEKNYYVIAGSLIRELCKDHGIPPVQLGFFKNLF